MKKILLVLSIVLLSFTAKAQIIVGGNIGISAGNGEPGVGIRIAPEIGYNFNRFLAAGGTISYQSRGNIFGITPYVRFNAAYLWDRLALHLSLEGPMRWTTDYQSYNAYLRPGLSVRLGGSVWLVAHIGNFGYSYVKSGDYEAKGWIAKADWDNISLGVCVSL